MKQSVFVVRRFKNRNGVFSWRVQGTLNGVRIRRNFKTQEEAAAEKAALEVKAAQLHSNLRSVSTWLSEPQVREAESVFARLPAGGRAMAFFFDLGVAGHREPLRQRPLAQAVDDYVVAKAQEHGYGLISASQLTTIRRHMNALKSRFSGLTVADLTAAQLVPYLRRGSPCLKTFNNRRGLVSTFLRFAERNDWIADNPLRKVPQHRIARRRGSAETLSAEQARSLMEYVETFEGGRLVPFFALCLFAGIRPCLRTGEILRLRPEHVRLDTGVIRIEPEVSKVRELRSVTIQPNLAAWLAACPLEQFPIIIPNLQKIRARIAKQFGLSHDVMRHTFISMFVAKFRSVGEAALQAGNSEAIIRKHYLNLKSPAEAEDFFGIMPRAADEPAGNVVPIGDALRPAI